MLPPTRSVVVVDSARGLRSLGLGGGQWPLPGSDTVQAEEQKEVGKNRPGVWDDLGTEDGGTAKGQEIQQFWSLLSS